MNKSPEITILAVALGLLAIGAAALGALFPSLQDITNISTTTAKGHMAVKLKEDEVQASLAPLTTPVLWNAPDNKHRLFISDGYLFYPTLYPDGNYLQKNDGTARTPGGVLISWYQKYGLDFTDPNIDRADADADGFSNKTEFMNEATKATDCDGSKSTNPVDPQSHPSYLSRLRLQKYDSRPFHIQFLGYQQLGGDYVFQISLKDVPSSQQPSLKKTGDALGVEGYIVGPFHQNIVEEENSNTHIKTQVDKSTLELDKPDIGFKIVLSFRQERDSPESTANFVMLMPSEVDKVVKVPRGQKFTPASMSTEYLVIDANDTGAVIRDTTTKQDITVPKLDPAEWNDIPVSTPSSATPKPQ